MQERKVFDTGLKVMKLDSLFTVFIDKIAVPNVTNYKVTTSESGETEVELKMKLNSEVTDLEFVFQDPRRKPEICQTQERSG